MSGAFKAGLVFGVIGLLVVAGLTLVFPLCGPLGAAIIGGAAGYFGVRWSTHTAGVGTGVLAGTIAGVLMLIAALAIFIVAFNNIKNDPQFQQMFQQALAQQQQQQDTKFTPQQQQLVLSAIAPVGGFCFGLLNLVAALVCGAIGGLIAARNNAPAATPPPPQPMGPPPLSPL